MNDGVYTDLSIKEYHNNKTHYSATQLKFAKKSLKEFEWYIKGKIKPVQKVEYDFGNAFELALLDKNGFEESVAIFNDEYFVNEAIQKDPSLTKPRSSKFYQDAVKHFNILSEGKYKITSEDFAKMEHMLESYYRDAVIQKLIANTEYQLSLFWTDTDSGLKMKTRPDICKRKKNSIVNLKTSDNGSLREFTKDLVNYEYPMQACIEMKGCLATGIMDTVDNYFWLVFEKCPPFNATIYEFQKEDISWCMDSLNFLLSKVKRAIDSDFFPGYSDHADNQYGIIPVQIPLYYKS